MSPVHTRRRSTTNPIRLPTSLTNLKSSQRSLSPSLTSPANPNSTLRLTAFVDPALPSPSLPLSPGLSRPLPPSSAELAQDRHARDRRPSLLPTSSASDGFRTPLLGGQFPGFERQVSGKATPSPLPSPGEDFERYATGTATTEQSGTQGNGIKRTAVGLGLVMDRELGTETAVQGGETGTWRRSFNPAVAGMGAQEREGGSRAASRTGSRGMGSFVAGLRRKNVSTAAGDGESVLSLRSDGTAGTKGMEEKKRLGYVFDDEGRDPFRGF